jgi:hypothetical protein
MARLYMHGAECAIANSSIRPRPTALPLINNHLHVHDATVRAVVLPSSK